MFSNNLQFRFQSTYSIFKGGCFAPRLYTEFQEIFNPFLFALFFCPHLYTFFRGFWGVFFGLSRKFFKLFSFLTSLLVRKKKKLQHAILIFLPLFYWPYFLENCRKKSPPTFLLVRIFFKQAKKSWMFSNNLRFPPESDRLIRFSKMAILFVTHLYTEIRTFRLPFFNFWFNFRYPLTYIQF